MLPKIELRASPSAEGFKPSRINKVRDLDPVDIITELVSFAGIARLISIKSARGIGVLDEDRKVDFGIDEHLKEFMARRDRPVYAVLRGGPRECQTEWHALSGGLVKSERTRLGGIV